MASKSNVRGRRVSWRALSTSLSSAAAEWLLMLLLFLDGLFSYLVTKFARFSKLQIPCLYCSRLDHIFGLERQGFYKDLICHAHKLEISSLAFCHVHQNLADVRDMCEVCLLSFATEKKSNSETYRSLVRKLERNIVNGEDGHLRLPVDPNDFEVQWGDVVEAPLLKKDLMLDSPTARSCSCCHELFANKSHLQRLLKTKSVTAEVELGVALFGQDGPGYLHGQGGSCETQEKSLRSSASFHAENNSFGPLSHIGYTEVKVTSDSESDALVSDDDGIVPVESSNLMEDPLSQSLKQEPAIELENQNVLHKALLDNMVLEKQIHVTDPSCLLPAERIHVVEHHDGDSLVPESTIGQGPEELNCDRYAKKGHPSPLSKVISEFPNSNSDEAKVSYVTNCDATEEGTVHPPLPDKVISEVSSMKLGEVETGDAALISSGTNVPEPKNSNPVETESRPTLTENDPGSLRQSRMDLSDAYKLAIGLRMNQLSPRNSIETELRQLQTTTSTETELRQLQITNDPGSSMHNQMDLNDAYKLAIGYGMNQPSPRDSYRVHEDLKLLLSQMSAARGFELPWSDITPSPRVHGQGDDLRMSDASSTTSQPNLHKRYSIERNESGFESLDGSIVSEIEGESPVDRLKRQIEVDRKSMILLYKELEEERNASTIAANQAMAMITRLQEEKAAMQMEALQYQRMMEEQAEYDQEVLQKSNDLLAQREEEILGLKAEIESYNRWLENETSPTKVKGELQHEEEDPIDRPFVKASDGKKVAGRNGKVCLDAEGNKAVILKNSLLAFEDEKLYITESLKRLEKKLHMFSNNMVYLDGSETYAREDTLPDRAPGNGRLFENDITAQNELKQGQIGESALFQQHESSISVENSHVGSAFTVKGNHNGVSTLPKFDDENQQSSMVNRTDLVSIEKEILHLNDRLEALEADRSFLEHTINSLRSGNDGIQFVEEIASHLCELRRIGVGRREQAPS